MRTFMASTRSPNPGHSPVRVAPRLGLQWHPTFVPRGPVWHQVWHFCLSCRHAARLVLPGAALIAALSKRNPKTRPKSTHFCLLSPNTSGKKLFLSAVSREFLPYRQLLAQDLKRPTLDVPGMRWSVTSRPDHPSVDVLQSVPAPQAPEV